MEGYKIVGVTGACILALGIFMPSRVATMAGYINYYTAHQTNGVILLLLALVAFVLVFTGSPAKLFLFGIITLVAVAWTFLCTDPSLHLLEANVGQMAADAVSLPMLKLTQASISRNLPWWIMLGGSSLLVVAGMMQVRRS